MSMKRETPKRYYTKPVNSSHFYQLSLGELGILKNTRPICGFNSLIRVVSLRVKLAIISVAAIVRRFILSMKAPTYSDPILSMRPSRIQPTAGWTYQRHGE